MTILAPVAAVRVPFRVNDRFADGGVPAVAIQRALEAWPGRVFFFLPRGWAMPGFSPTAQGCSLVVLRAREVYGRVEVLTGSAALRRETMKWRAVPADAEEGYLYAR